MIITVQTTSKHMNRGAWQIQNYNNYRWTLTEGHSQLEIYCTNCVHMIEHIDIISCTWLPIQRVQCQAGFSSIWSTGRKQANNTVNNTTTFVKMLSNSLICFLHTNAFPDIPNITWNIYFPLMTARASSHFQHLSVKKQNTFINYLIKCSVSVYTGNILIFRVAD